MILNYDSIKEENLSEKLDGQCIMDLISVNVNQSKDWEIFTKWHNDFKKRDIPFFVTDDIKILSIRGKKGPVAWKTLWVEEIEAPMTNNGKPKERLVFDMTNVKG